jgi:hypothetical protein
MSRQSLVTDQQRTGNQNQDTSSLVGRLSIHRVNTVLDFLERQSLFGHPY